MPNGFMEALTMNLKNVLFQLETLYIVIMDRWGIGIIEQL